MPLEISEVTLCGKYPAKWGTHWCITPIDVKCNVNTKNKQGPIHCGYSPIPAGTPAIHYHDNIYWCDACSKLMDNIDMPSELLDMMAKSKLTDGKCKLISFGFKSGEPTYDKKGIRIDVRKTVRNPWSFPELRSMTGLDGKVRDFISSCPKSNTIVTSYLRYAKAGYTIYVGCQGGRHRSVAIVEMMAEKLREQGLEVDITHRDLKVKKTKAKKVVN